MFVPAVETEVEDDARTGRLVPAAPKEARRRFRQPEELTVGADGVHVRDDRPGRYVLTGLCLDTGRGATSVEDDPTDAAAGPDFHTQPLGEGGKRLRHRPGSAARVPDAAARLHVGDTAKHRRRGVRR